MPAAQKKQRHNANFEFESLFRRCFFGAAVTFFQTLRRAGHSPRRSRFAATYHALFFTGRFFQVAWQLLIICKDNCNAT
jgi:hypothetical protein